MVGDFEPPLFELVYLGVPLATVVGGGLMIRFARGSEERIGGVTAVVIALIYALVFVLFLADYDEQESSGYDDAVLPALFACIAALVGVMAWGAVRLLRR